MGKYLDKTGLQYFYNKLKDKFADKSTIETKLDSLTGAFTWKGELSALPTDLSGYSAGNVIKVGTKEYVCTETNGTKSWDELGDEGSYLLKTAAEDTYFKRTEGDTLIYSIGNIVNDTKNFLTPVEIKIVDSGTYTDNIQNIKDYIENLQGDKISIGTAYGYVIPVCGASSEGFLQGIAFCGDDWEQKGASLIWCYASDPKSGEGSMFYYGTIDPSTGLYKDSGKILTDLSELELKQLPTITKSKLSTDVQTSLGKADTALQSVPRATLTSDGTVRANPIKPPLKDLANSSPSYGGVKVAMGSDGVLGVGWGSKDYFGVVKIGDGLNVSNGLVSIADKSITKAKLDTSVQTSLGKADTALQSVPRATLTSDGTVRANPINVPLKDLANSSTSYGGVKVAMGSDGVLGVGWGSKDYFGVVKIGDGLNVSNGLVSIADKSITKAKLDTSVQTSLGKADNSLQIGETNTQSKQTVITTESTQNYNNGLKVQNSSNGTEITPTGITFGLNTQPIGIYKDDSYKLKLNSASGSSIQLSGLATPTNDTDAVNKKYVDDKISGFVKLGKTNEASTSVTTFKANTTGQALNIQALDTITYLNGTSVSVGTRSSETAASLTKTALVFGKQGTNYGRVEVNSNNKLQITGLDTPTSDTNAANKKYVDDNINLVKIPVLTLDTSDTEQVISDTIEAFLSNSGYEFGHDDYFILNLTDWNTLATKCGILLFGDSSMSGGTDEHGNVSYLYTGIALSDITNYTPVGQVNIMFVMPPKDSENYVKYKIEIIYSGCITEDRLSVALYNYVPKTDLATSLQAITIYIDNTAEHKAANLANIKAYEDNLKELGFTTTNDHNIPINIYGTTQKGFIGGNTAANRYHGIMGANNQWQMFVVAPDGTYASSPVLGGVISQLNTTNKTSVITAINEVNTLAKSKASTSVATQSANGLMSAADKKKLDNTLQLGEENVGSDTYTTLKNNYLNLTVENSADYENGGLRLAGNALEFFDSSNNRTVLKGINSKTIAVGDYDSSGTSVSGGTITGLSTPTNDSDAATKAYVDSKSSEKVTLAYNPDDSYMTGEQYKSIFTDAYENSKIPNVELVYTAEGDYQVLSLTRVDKDDSYYHLYFSCSSAEDSANVYTYGVKVDVLRESDDTTVNHDMTCTELQSTSFNTIAKTVANNVDSTEILTASTVTKSLTMADKKNFIIMPTVTAAQIRLPSSPTDGYTITVVGVAAVQNFELKTASSNAPIYNVGGGSTATKFSLSTRGKVISTYSATLKQWITYKQSIA